MRDKASMWLFVAATVFILIACVVELSRGETSFSMFFGVLTVLFGALAIAQSRRTGGRR